MKESRVISARVPSDVADLFDKACISKGKTKSSYMVELMTMPSLPAKRGSLPMVNDTEIPEEIKALLSGIGGVGVGYVIFKIIKAYMPKEKFTDEEITVYASIGAISCGLATAYGLTKLMANE